MCPPSIARYCMITYGRFRTLRAAWDIPIQTASSAIHHCSVCCGEAEGRLVLDSRRPMVRARAQTCASWTSRAFHSTLLLGYWLVDAWILLAYLRRTSLQVIDSDGVLGCRGKRWQSNIPAQSQIRLIS